MSSTPVSFPHVYLVELFNKQTYAQEDADVCAKLELGLQRIYDHLLDYALPLSPDVSFDTDGILEGIAVFTSTGDMLACLSVYHLDRDTGSATTPEITEMCKAPDRSLQHAICSLLGA